MTSSKTSSSGSIETGFPILRCVTVFLSSFIKAICATYGPFNVYSITATALARVTLSTSSKYFSSLFNFGGSTYASYFCSPTWLYTKPTQFKGFSFMIGKDYTNRKPENIS